MGLRRVKTYLSGNSMMLIVGASMYWCTALVNASLPIRDKLADGTAGLLFGSFSLAVSLLVCMCLMAMSKRFLSTKAPLHMCVAATILGIISFVLPMVADVPLCDAASFLLNTVAAVLRDIQFPLLMLFWSFVFACMPKKEAGVYVFFTTVISILLFGCILLISLFFPIRHVLSILLALSPLLFVLSGKEFHAEERSAKVNHREIVGFYFPRAVFGLAIGIVGSEALATSNPQPDLFACIVLIVTTGVIYLVANRRIGFGNIVSSVPMLPMVCVVAIATPFFGKDIPSLCGLAAGVSWLAWIILSSFQLSEYKHTLGMSEAVLSFTEKAVVVTCWLAGSIASAFLIPIVKEYDWFQALGDSLLVGVAYITVLASTYALFKLGRERERDSAVEQLSRLSAQVEQTILSNFADAHNLTPREKDVFYLLAQGHTRPYICKSLFIGDATARTHISHIYEKLEIHKKEEIFEALSEYRQTHEYEIKNMLLK